MLDRSFPWKTYATDDFGNNCEGKQHFVTAATSHLRSKQSNIFRLLYDHNSEQVNTTGNTYNLMLRHFHFQYWHAYYRQIQQLLLVSAIGATCFDRVGYPQALKYIIVISQVKMSTYILNFERSHKLYKPLVSCPACKSHLFCAILYFHLWPVWLCHSFLQ